jgi:hypothetical protein
VVFVSSGDDRLDHEAVELEHSREELGRGGVGGGRVGGVDVRVVAEVGTGGVLGDVVLLGFEVGEVAYAVFEVAFIPNLTGS